MNMSEIEHIKQLEAELAAAKASVKRKGGSVMPVIQPRYITLNEWAASQFSRVPHYNTLIKWVHDGRINPQPQKIGRVWQVRPNAEYVSD
jgi:hypothetical protein